MRWVCTPGPLVHHRHPTCSPSHSPCLMWPGVAHQRLKGWRWRYRGERAEGGNRRAGEPRTPPAGRAFTLHGVALCLAVAGPQRLGTWFHGDSHAGAQLPGWDSQDTRVSPTNVGQPTCPFGPEGDGCLGQGEYPAGRWKHLRARLWGRSPALQLQRPHPSPSLPAWSAPLGLGTQRLSGYKGERKGRGGGAGSPACPISDK